MSKITYVEKRFSSKTLAIIDYANVIIDEYKRQGYDLTLRQLYYQFVSRDLIENNERSYKMLGSIINDARLAGYVDWNAIEDRTRNLQNLPHWKNPAEAIRSVVSFYYLDKWADQDYRIEVWVEKDALLGVVESACDKWDVPYFSCRGYVSQSEMWNAAQRFIGHSDDGQKNILIHLGDHDPSGIDMTRDIEDRLFLFGANVEVSRIALNQIQIDEYNPPPNPAKITDSRFESYRKKYSNESWELDALEPSVIVRLIEREIANFIDEAAFEKQLKRQESDRRKIVKLSKRA